MPHPLHGAAVPGRGRRPDQRRRLAAADGAELAHPADRRRRGGRADAGDRGRDPAALGMGGLAFNRLPDLPVAAVDVLVDPVEDAGTRRLRQRIADLGEGQLQRAALVDQPLANDQHVAEPVEELPARLRRRQLRQRRAEFGQHPCIDPVGPGQPAARLGEVAAPPAPPEQLSGGDRRTTEKVLLGEEALFQAGPESLWNWLRIKVTIITANHQNRAENNCPPESQVMKCFLVPFVGNCPCHLPRRRWYLPTYEPR